MLWFPSPFQSVTTFFTEFLILPNLGRAVLNQLFFRLPLEMDQTRIVDLSEYEKDFFPVTIIADSYSVGDRCYCHNIVGFEGSDAILPTPMGNLTAQEICDLLGPGPGSVGRPMYNDAQVCMYVCIVRTIRCV